MAEEKVDVFISGAGPVGLLLAIQLARWGVSTYIIDAADRERLNEGWEVFGTLALERF